MDHQINLLTKLTKKKKVKINFFDIMLKTIHNFLKILKYENKIHLEMLEPTGANLEFFFREVEFNCKFLEFRV